MKIKGKVVVVCGIVFCVLLSFLAVVSCAEKTEKVSKYPDLLNEAVDTINYSQFVDSIKYIPLEATDACLIGNITDVEISEEHIFVLDLQMQTVWIFSKNGKYHSQIFHKGDAPGEYVNMCQFEYDDNNKQIIILDLWTHSLLFYTLEGKYLTKVSHPSLDGI